MLRQVPATVALAAILLLPGPGQAEDGRVLGRFPTVLVDGTGHVLGQAFVFAASVIDQVVAWMRVGGLDLVLGATSDRLVAIPQGRLAFGTSDCTGTPFFLPEGSTGWVFDPVAVGSDGTAVFAPDGPSEVVVVNSSLHPLDAVPCQAEAGAVTLLQRAIEIVNLASFPPPYTVR